MRCWVISPNVWNDATVDDWKEWIQTEGKIAIGYRHNDAAGKHQGITFYSGIKKGDLCIVAQGMNNDNKRLFLAGFSVADKSTVNENGNESFPNRYFQERQLINTLNQDELNSLDIQFSKANYGGASKQPGGALYKLNTNTPADKKIIDTILGKIQEKYGMKKYTDLLKHSKNLVFTGAPGTGKTYLAKQIAEEFAKEDKNIKFVQFHPSYDYTDFVEGLRPINDGKDIEFKLKNGIFKELCIKAKNDPDNNYVFIIDEINRAEISKVFGELFFSIDPGYRGIKGKVQLQYSNLHPKDDPFYDGFYVPENVYIIATMNDIDRSVEPFDFAMKRRFTWYEITPKDTYANMWKYKDKNNNDIPFDWASDAKERMDRLNKVITTEFSSAYQIGPSYFLKLNNFDGDFEELWKYHLKPVLQEYVKGFSDAKVFKELEKAYKLEDSSSKTPDNSNG